jgi:hypothetical protein
MRDLNAHWLARDLDVPVAPVELISFARTEQQRDECRCVHYVATPRLAPAGGIAAHRVVRAVEPFAQQQIVNTRDAQLLAPRSRLVFLQQRIEPYLKRPQLRQWLHPAPVRHVCLWGRGPRFQAADNLASVSICPWRGRFLNLAGAKPPRLLCGRTVL